MITIVIPTYNRAKLLRRSIDSAVNQTFKNLLVYVVDNNSTDDTQDVVNEWIKKDPRVVYFRQPTNLGMLGNYASSLEKISSPYFTFLSDDDLLLPNYCADAIALFAQVPHGAFAALATCICTLEGKVIRNPLAEWSREGVFLPGEGVIEMIGKFPVPNTVLFQTRLAKEIKIDFENQPLWDCDFLMQLAIRYPIAISKKVGGLFFSHEGSYSTTCSKICLFESYQRLKDRMQSLTSSLGMQSRAICALEKHQIQFAKRNFWSSIALKNWDETLYFYTFLASANKTGTVHRFYQKRAHVSFFAIPLKWVYWIRQYFIRFCRECRL